ncbi:hypothetical protein BJ912DRAFT_939133 [Pholiota molesta]|nr:hypothetical protein BJ912DRAFT_939133 [Pholiota molesta]
MSTEKLSKRRRVADSDSERKDSRIQELEDIIEDLKAQNKRQKRRIETLEATQVQEELQDLRKSSEEASEGAEMDPLARMRKLLRNFSDLMISNTISADMKETCPVCYEQLKLKKCSSLECQHILLCDQDFTKLVHMTEQDRWDKLLTVAQAWDAFDRRGGLETSEEEDEENFINDGSGRSEVSVENDETSSQEPGTHTTDAEDSKASTPPPSRVTPFHESPTKEKKKRLANLAAERAKKKQK